MEQPHLAREIMRKRLITLAPEQHVLDGIALLLRYNISGAPVVDEQDNYLGVFSEKCSMRVLKVTSDWAHRTLPHLPDVRARDFMVTDLITLRPDMDAFEAVEVLIRHHISGAPVVDQDRRFLGVFSEKTSMSVVLAAAYDQMPTTRLEAFMNTDRGRIIPEDIELMAVAQIFIDTPYRRLPVVRDGKLVGQVCRRDVLRAQHHLSKFVRDREQALRADREQAAGPGAPPEDLADPETFCIAAFMDRKALTITEDTDLLDIARIFLHTPYRRLPVLRDGKLVGQISRHDVLRAAHELSEVKSRPKRWQSLFLSAVVERHESPLAE